MTSKSCHVAIVGGGIIGCSTAFYLTSLGHSNVTVYEQCGIACHSSGKAGGFLARSWCDETDLRELARASYSLHMELRKEFPDLDYRDVDTYTVNTSHRTAEKEVKSPVEWLSADHLTNVELLETSDNTAKVSPKPLCDKLLSVAQSRGARVNISKVTGVQSSDNHVTHLVTSTGLVAVDVVVVAAGPWSTRFIQEHFPHYPLPSPQPQTRAHSVVLQPDTQLGSQCLFQYHRTRTGAVDPEIYPLPDGTVYVCGEVDKVPLPPAPHLVHPDTDKCNNLIRQAAHAVKCLGSARVVVKQACYLPDSYDHIPIIGKVPGTLNVYIGTGHTFWGILNGPATGKCLAELISRGKTETCDLTPFNPDRFL